jgi:hypothetical protein
LEKSGDKKSWGSSGGIGGSKEDLSGNNDTLIIGFMAGYGKTEVEFDQSNTIRTGIRLQF